MFQNLSAPKEIYVTSVPPEFRHIEYFVGGTVPIKALIPTDESDAETQTRSDRYAFYDVAGIAGNAKRKFKLGKTFDRTRKKRCPQKFDIDDLFYFGELPCDALLPGEKTGDIYRGK